MVLVDAHECSLTSGNLQFSSPPPASHKLSRAVVTAYFLDRSHLYMTMMTRKVITQAGKIETVILVHDMYNCLCLY